MDVAGPGRMHNPTAPLQEAKKKVSVPILGEAEFYWCCHYLFLSVYYVLRVCLRSQSAAFLRDNLVPVLKSLPSCIGFLPS